jgi:hypothetical protein
VCLDGSLGDVDLGGDRLVRLSLRHTPQHFEFALTQRTVGISRAILEHGVVGDRQ